MIELNDAAVTARNIADKGMSMAWLVPGVLNRLCVSTWAVVLSCSIAPMVRAVPGVASEPGAPVAVTTSSAELALPGPQHAGRLSLEAALSQRRSLRSFSDRPLSAAQVGQLMWAAQGLSDAQGRRTAPSAGGLYPLIVYLVAGRVEGVPGGVYRYLPEGHRLRWIAGGDRRADVAAAARRQSWMGDAPAIVVIAAVPARTASRYGERASRYVSIEAGAAAQNLLLQAVALGLGGTLVGAFDETELSRCLAVAAVEQPLIVIPVGYQL